MNLKGIDAAEKAAKEFLARARAVRESGSVHSALLDSPLYGSKETGALRRASMDLTRALAEMRKPGV